ncbi:acyl carrier protein [Streptomyces phaeoluteigriseus]|uniref:Actinorhodin polyketide synthase n=1 Tax=Streptomyces phaeoluteigriseus TaxID=114686 RepID=A0A1V6MZ47_9ACTN|nr:acyl carrier protein [Streptomyces phaeoluteigriseus]OQD57691.1 actinorhodin polyketide synthase [Streptomyces phaeoluteigriseus]USQ84477.1 acyl carrier protein [Streptomyces phaeoluteigriseus]
MSDRTFTLDDLRRILLESAGAEEGVDLYADISDTGFEELGYESLALLEAGGRIEREFGVSLDDVNLSDITTPRALVEAVNELLSVDTAAA